MIGSSVSSLSTTVTVAVPPSGWVSLFTMIVAIGGSSSSRIAWVAILSVPSTRFCDAPLSSKITFSVASSSRGSFFSPIETVAFSAPSGMVTMVPSVIV